MEYQEEKRNCQNCKKDFIIESDDFSFYEKMKVPAPTFCPHCRLIRRFIWRNERTLHKRKCDMCKKNIISMYDDKVAFSVYCPDCWRGDNWDPTKYEQKYDFSKPFFSQWQDLFNKVPRPSVWQVGNCIDTEYTNFVLDVKNVYLAYSVIYGAEDVYYSSNVDSSKQIVDSYNVAKSEFIYENIGSTKNYNCQYSYWSSNCIDCNFIMDCNNCKDCFMCVNLRNKTYCILNEQYSKEEYLKKIKEFNLGSYKSTKVTLEKFINFSLEFPKKYSRIINCIDSIGDDLRDCRNIKFCFNVYNMENVKFAHRSLNTKDSMDICNAGNFELGYEHASGGSDFSLNIKFIINGSPALNEVEYIDLCQSSSNLFGCIGLKNKKYHILNKEYSKEEYLNMIEKIKQHMNEMPYIDSKGRVYKYGEFFPYELSPFGYNDTVINDYFPLNREEIIEKGYPYKEKVDNKYTITLKAEDIPNDIKDIDDTILDEVIECEKSGKAFKITPFELQFYRRMNIPIPHLHPDERYKERMELRNPMVLYHRACMKEGCNNEFETTYAPDRPEVIYCDSCYKQEVY